MTKPDVTDDVVQSWRDLAAECRLSAFVVGSCTLMFTSFRSARSGSDYLCTILYTRVP